MRRRRTRYQFGSIEQVARSKGPDVWRYRWFEDLPAGRIRRSEIVGTIEQYPTEAAALKAVEGLRMLANPDRPNAQQVTMGALVDRFLLEEHADRFTTGKGHRTILNTHIRPKWADYALREVRPGAVEIWLRTLDLAPKTKRNIKSVMMVLFNCAMRWELLNPEGQNPMRLVRVPGGTKRKKLPRVLTPEEFTRLLAYVEGELYRTIVATTTVLGLRISEVSGLRWGDFDFEGLSLHVQRNVVVGRQGDLKTAGSEKKLPVDSALGDLLLNWRTKTPWQSDSDWVFASPYRNGATPYWLEKMRQPVLQRAAKKAGLANPEQIGWHTLRHTYSSLLRALGVDLKVQQELLRHADIRTTMNIYTQAVPDALRAANHLVVGELLPTKVM